MKRRQKGFTLVEVLAVLIVMGIISSIAVPTINNMIKSNQVEKEKSILSNLNERSRLYTAITGKSIDDLINEGITLDNIISKLVNEGYLEETPSISNDKEFSFTNGEWIVGEKNTSETDNDKDTDTTYPSYEHGVRYYKGDIVTYNNKVYKAKRKSRNRYPGNNKYWKEIENN